LVVEGFAGFSFEDFEEEGEFGGFDGVLVDVDAVDVVEEDSFSFGGGEAVGDVGGGGWGEACCPRIAIRGSRDMTGFGGDLVDGGIFLLKECVGVVGGVVAEVPIEEVLVGSEEEGS
jgi:hypothetical protein